MFHKLFRNSIYAVIALSMLFIFSIPDVQAGNNGKTTAQYDYEIRFLTDRGNSFYTECAIPVYIKTDNPDPNDNIKVLENEKNIAKNAGEYYDIKYLSNDGNKTFRKVENGYMFLLRFSTAGEHNVQIYENDDFVASIKLHVKDYETERESWAGKIMKDSGADALSTPLEKAEAVEDYFKPDYNDPDLNGENKAGFHYPVWIETSSNDQNPTGMYYPNLAGSPADPFFVTNIMDSYTSPNIFAYLAENFMGFEKDQIHSCYFDHRRGSDQWRETHNKCRITVDNEDHYFCICPDYLLSKKEKEDISIINLEDDTYVYNNVYYSNGGKWHKDNSGWWYGYPNGNYAYGSLVNINNSLYYFNSSGYMVTGWKYIDDSWYYFKSSGAMVKDNWAYTDGKWYLFAENGHMIKGWYREEVSSSKENKYYFNNSGALVTGWFKDPSSGLWFYQTTYGIKTDTWLNLNGTYYYFTPSGHMMTGWLDLGAVYYFYSDGSMNTKNSITLNGKTYNFQSSGVCKNPPAVKSGWVKESGNWRFYKKGMLTTGWTIDNGKWYYFNESGNWCTGWKFINGRWFYLNYEGGNKTGYSHIGDGWFYFNNDGEMCTEWVNIDGTWYYFSKSSGKQIYGRWQKIDEYWYFFDKNGLPLKNIIKEIDNSTYCFDSEGRMYVNRLYLNEKGEYLYFDSNGQLLEKNHTGFIKGTDFLKS